MSVLAEPVLELNNGWNPLKTTTVRNAFSKIFKGTARIVNPDDCTLHDFESWLMLPYVEGHPYMETYAAKIRLPEIIVLNSDGRFGRRDKIAFSRRNLLKRDNHSCQYCGLGFPKNELTVDHVFPKSRGGSSGWLNMVAACFPCNSKKKDLTLAESGMKLLSKPYEPKWSPLFKANSFKPSWKQFLPDKLFA